MRRKDDTDTVNLLLETQVPSLLEVLHDVTGELRDDRHLQRKSGKKEMERCNPKDNSNLSSVERRASGGGKTHEKKYQWKKRTTRSKSQYWPLNAPRRHFRIGITDRRTDGGKDGRADGHILLNRDATE